VRRAACTEASRRRTRAVPPRAATWPDRRDRIPPGCRAPRGSGWKLAPRSFVAPPRWPWARWGDAASLATQRAANRAKRTPPRRCDRTRRNAARLATRETACFVPRPLRLPPVRRVAALVARPRPHARAPVDQPWCAGGVDVDTGASRDLDEGEPGEVGAREI